MYINETNMLQFSLGYIQTDGKNNSHSCKNCQLSSLQLQTVGLFLQFSLFFFVSLFSCDGGSQSTGIFPLPSLDSG